MNDLATHLASAYKRHSRWCRENRIPIPKAFTELVRAVTSGQECSGRDVFSELGDAAGVPITVPYSEAARLLSVSQSTIRRMVDAGTLRAIDIGRRKFIPRAELETYVANKLNEQGATQ